MERVSKFLRLSTVERRLLMKSMGWLWIVRIVLWLLPFRMVRELLKIFLQKSKRRVLMEPGAVERIAWAVTITSQYVPGATCLTQALVTQLMLARTGHDATVRIGVARTDGGQFKAHAWVEMNGHIVIGGPEAWLKQYTELAAVDGESW